MLFYMLVKKELEILQRIAIVIINKTLIFSGGLTWST